MTETNRHVTMIRHLTDEHGVTLTRREAATITPDRVEALWSDHGPHRRCTASMWDIEQRHKEQADE